MFKSTGPLKQILLVLLITAAAGFFTFAAWKAFLYWEVASSPLLSRSEVQKMIEEEDYPRAILAVRRALLDKPGDRTLKSMLGDLYEENDEAEKAGAIFKKLVDEDGSDPWLHFGLARSLYHQNQIEEAIEHLKTAKSLAKSYPDPGQATEILTASRSLLAEIYAEYTKEYRRAIEELKELLELEPTNAEARYQLATAYAYSNQLQSAYREYQTVITENPGTEMAKYAENAIQYVRERRSPKKSGYLLDYGH